MNNDRSGIPTPYRGIIFRSRLEAKWAYMFDWAGWKWGYEPFDYGGYVPDFVIMGDRSVLVEVKPVTALSEYDLVGEEVVARVAGEWGGDILILGAHHSVTSPECKAAIGLLIEQYREAPMFPMPEGNSDDDLPLRAYPSEAHWTRCYECKRVGFVSFFGDWSCRPCKHHSKYHPDGVPDLWPIEEHWAEACNATKWRKAPPPSGPVPPWSTPP